MFFAIKTAHYRTQHISVPPCLGHPDIVAQNTGQLQATNSTMNNEQQTGTNLGIKQILRVRKLMCPCFTRQVGKNNAEPASNTCADSMIPSTPPNPTAKEPSLPRGWETAPKCPRFRTITLPKPRTTVRVSVEVRRLRVGEHDVAASNMVSTFVPLTLDKPHFDRIVRSFTMRARNSHHRSATGRSRCAFIPPHLAAMASPMSRKGGVIVGSPPCRRRDLMNRARKYDREWC